MSRSAALPSPLRCSELAALLRWRLLAGNLAALLAGALLVSQPLAAARWVALLAGGALLIAACGILNQWQERDLDALLARTCRRPLVTGRLQPTPALIAALLLATAALALLYTCAPNAAAVGLLALFCYNALYTPLKRRTLLALLPGSLAGALPPLLGWCAAGGAALDPRGLLPVLLMLLWQLPHLGLLALATQDDCRAAGLPTLTDHLPPAQLTRLVRLWSGAFCVAALLLPLLGLLHGVAAWIWLAVVALLLPLPAWDTTLARRLHLFPLLLAAVLLLQHLAS